MTEKQSQFVKLMERAARRHNSYVVFKDFCAITANSTWPTIAYIGNREELERRMMAQEMMDIFHNPAERKSNDIIVPETLAQKGLLFDLGGIGK